VATPEPEAGAQIERYLACPRCFGPTNVRDTAIECRSAQCTWRGIVAEGVAVMTEDGLQPSYFDDKTGTMRHGYSGAGTNSLFYERQARAVEKEFRPDTVVLDVGCGPLMPYQRRDDHVVIGLDLSWLSLRENSKLDLRVFASGARLPVPSQSIDTIVCMYAIHHFAGNTVAECRKIVETAFSEFGRALKPGGDLLVFEVAPRWPFALVQWAVWDLAKRVLGPKLDMFFWGSQPLLRVAGRALPRGTAVRVERFDGSWWTTFPPIFALPQLRIPRLFYPFDMRLYRWRLP
jgi:SAM-dependent methyltransferase